MPALDVQSGKQLRRSQRVFVSVDVVVVWSGAKAELASEETKTLIVNSHGALLLLRKGVELNDAIILRNAMTQEELACRVVHVSTSDQLGMMNVGVEFIEPAPHFWHIAFPPEDWNIHCPEAKGYTAPQHKKVRQ